MRGKPIVIGCDNAAVSLKNSIVEFLRDKGIIVEDVGVNSPDDATVYPVIAQKVCDEIISSDIQKMEF